MPQHLSGAHFHFSLVIKQALNRSLASYGMENRRQYGTGEHHIRFG